MIMRILALSVILLINSLFASGQNLIGYNGRDIQRFMKENRRDMNSEIVVNNKFKYLKYSDNSENQTLLFFLNNDSVCKSIKLICGRDLRTQKVKEFNTIYRSSGENSWTDKRDSIDYRIDLRDEKWSCVITIEPDK
jgi:hypothetical protein